ncbi:MAG TPA: hypothetical protein VII56_17565 [Rhizomicrobium sp.]
MATVTNIQGLEIYFDPAVVCAVANHDETGNPVTTVYGILTVPVMTAEAVAAFLARLGIAAEFAELTRPNGSKVMLRATSVGMMRGVVAGEYPPVVKSVAVAGGLTQALVEDPATAAAALRTHGSKI